MSWVQNTGPFMDAAAERLIPDDLSRGDVIEFTAAPGEAKPRLAVVLHKWLDERRYWHVALLVDGSSEWKVGYFGESQEIKAWRS